MHKRREFLEAIRAQLELLPDFAGVWIQRVAPARAGYPAVTLYAVEEPVETLTIHQPQRPQDRILTFSVVGWVKGSASDEKAEEDMDKIAVLIETTLTAPVGVDDMSLVATDFLVDEEEAEIHAITLTYNIFYTTTENNPTI